MSFEENPQGAASLAQVHKAVLHDGRTVAVKVQHPKVQRQSSKDIMVIEVSLQVKKASVLLAQRRVVASDNCGSTSSRARPYKMRRCSSNRYSWSVKMDSKSLSGTSYPVEMKYCLKCRKKLPQGVPEALACYFSRLNIVIVILGFAQR